MRDPVMIARTWSEKTRQTEDYYDRFVFLWFALNALYNEFLEGSERRAIGDMVYSGRYGLSNSQIRKILSVPGVEFFKNRIVRDCRSNGRDTSEAAAILKSDSYSCKKKLNHLLRILYQVRCNLFHGNKVFGRDSDDEVVRNGAMALDRVVEALVEETQR